jgi:hypothetical protein
LKARQKRARLRKRPERIFSDVYATPSPEPTSPTIVGIVSVGQHAPAHAPNHTAVTLDQGRERRLVAPNGVTLQQMTIRAFDAVTGETAQTTHSGNETIAFHDNTSLGGRIVLLIILGEGAIAYNIFCSVEAVHRLMV